MKPAFENSKNPRKSPVPEGQTKIAQRFSVGIAMITGSSPEGTADLSVFCVRVSRPSGTWHFCILNPTLKRWAILRMSLRDRGCGDLQKALGPGNPAPCLDGFKHVLSAGSNNLRPLLHNLNSPLS